MPGNKIAIIAVPINGMIAAGHHYRSEQVKLSGGPLQSRLGRPDIPINLAIEEGRAGVKRCGCWLPGRNQGKPVLSWLGNNKKFMES